MGEEEREDKAIQEHSISRGRTGGTFSASSFSSHHKLPIMQVSN